MIVIIRKQERNHTIEFGSKTEVPIHRVIWLSFIEGASWKVAVETPGGA